MATVPPLFESLLRLAVENGASDIIVKAERRANLRINGELEDVEMEPIPTAEILAFITATLPPRIADRWETELQADYSLDMNDLGVGRFRVNAYHQRNLPAVVFRLVRNSPPSFAELRHEDAVFKKLCAAQDGIVLICGATGSGKSSTLAAMMRHLNETRRLHIVTLEDPIEYVFKDEMCVFSQREIGIDAPDFRSGLRAAMRQDPDVILVGEMRDAETFQTALSAAETGHLVFGTLHASDARQALQRVFDFFTPEQQHGMRRVIAASLRGIISQQLCPDLEGSGRVPVTEIFLIDPLARNKIVAGEFERVPDMIEAGKEAGSKSFNADLFRLIKSGVISRQDGLLLSPNGKALEMNLKGIFIQSGGVVG